VIGVGQYGKPVETGGARVVAGEEELPEEAGGATTDVGLVQSTPSQTTVEVYTVEVGLPTGQSVTVGAQEVIV